MSTTGIIIRRAEKQDCPRLLDLIRELAVFERAPNDVTVSLEHFENSGFGPHPVWWAFVAEEGENPASKKNIIGFALYYIRYSTWKGQRMYLEDIIVTEEARGKGIGKLLFDQLIIEAKEKDFSGIVWQVLDWNESAKNFYRKYNARFDNEWVTCTINL
jgi:ribosomal protein S18 acetylase RimI-like enzyme